MSAKANSAFVEFDKPVAKIARVWAGLGGVELWKILSSIIGVVPVSCQTSVVRSSEGIDPVL